MALFSVGSVVGELILDTTKWGKGMATARTSMTALKKGMGAVAKRSMEVAKRTISAFKRMATGVKNAVKQSIDALDRFAQHSRASFAAFNAAITIGIGYLLKLAMRAEETENLFSVMMGRMGESAGKWVRELSSALGVFDTEVKENMSRFYGMVTAMGVAEESAFDMSKTLTQLAYDVSSLRNVDYGTAFTKIASGLAGQMRPLRQWGVLVDENSVKAWAYRNNLVRAGETLTQQQMVVARFAVILQGLSEDQGDLQRTAGSATNQMRRMWSQLKQLGADIGSVLLPKFTELLVKVNQFSRFAAIWIRKNKELTKSLLMIGLAVAGITAAIGGLTLVIPVLKMFFTTIATLGALASIEMGVVIASVLALGAAYMVVMKQIEKSRRERPGYGPRVAEYAEQTVAMDKEQNWTQENVEKLIRMRRTLEYDIRGVRELLATDLPAAERKRLTTTETALDEVSNAMLALQRNALNNARNLDATTREYLQGMMPHTAVSQIVGTTGRITTTTMPEITPLPPQEDVNYSDLIRRDLTTIKNSITENMRGLLSGGDVETRIEDVYGNWGNRLGELFREATRAGEPTTSEGRLQAVGLPTLAELRERLQQMQELRATILATGTADGQVDFVALAGVEENIRDITRQLKDAQAATTELGKNDPYQKLSRSAKELNQRQKELAAGMGELGRVAKEITDGYTDAMAEFYKGFTTTRDYVLNVATDIKNGMTNATATFFNDTMDILRDSERGWEDFGHAIVAMMDGVFEAITESFNRMVAEMLVQKMLLGFASTAMGGGVTSGGSAAKSVSDIGSGTATGIDWNIGGGINIGNLAPRMASSGDVTVNVENNTPAEVEVMPTTRDAENTILNIVVKGAKNNAGFRHGLKGAMV